MRVRAIIALLLVATVTTGCSEDRRSPGPESLDDVDVSAVATVEVDESGFDPPALSIESGEAFDLVNVGEEPHSLELDDPFIDTGEILPGETTRIAMRTVGEHIAVDGTDAGHTLEISITVGN